ncbi:hypothetical protein DPMN_020454 [Dreissena polymorpha]|uniref:Uncharacterized protein n=1 Tax=Dreissena polymorpha TaxID=45954 RepID=A0A9D4S886_DREPO|nr:hypothetical protein DPMN_020454 [Dreissena polymorpha]
MATSGVSKTVCNSARQSLTPSKTALESPAGAQTVSTPSQTVLDFIAGAQAYLETSQTVLESVQVPHRSKETVWKSPSGVWESAACSPKVWNIVWYRVLFSCRRPHGLYTVTDCQ